MTGSNRLTNSVYTGDGGGSRYSLMPVTRTAKSHATESAMNAKIAPPRLWSHAPSALSGTSPAPINRPPRLRPPMRPLRCPRRGRNSRLRTAPRRSSLRGVLRNREVERAVVGRNVDLEKLQIVGARNDVVRDAGRL